MMVAYEATIRDRVASTLANAVLNTIATKRYREIVNGAIRLGLNQATIDAKNPPFTEPLDD